ncbi:M56 family metallopeptidase [Neolewinella persica]|uniref:M56 family metallopeptidase n=1 Tax=Neolewinella persica TaxID=70998 RepID=UPI00035E076F|nr:M56 family metallopeptidase [Neolewinella persica]
MNHLLSATILLFAVWPAYYLLLRYSDRYSLNRLLLLLVMVAVVTLPFVNFSSPAPVVTQSIQGTISYLEEGVITGGGSIDPVPKEIRYDENGGEILIANRTAVTFFMLPKMYYFGLKLLIVVLGFRLLFILILHLRSRLNGDGTYRLLHPSAKPGQAYTFGRNLYFSTDVPDDRDFNHILAHERIHARQLHSLDILLSEVFLCIFWFHPAAWWLRAKMRANLEFLVDQAVISSGADRRDYQLALVRQSQGAYGLALALPFSEPTLKSRIFRMTGIPEYRVIAVVAAVVLVFWLGVSLLVINGNLFDDAPHGREYLEAAAHPGDPYYEYYQNTLPEELTTLEIYTNRMVTVDEYLQLRAILGKVPGAKLFVFKNAFDEGYSLELSHGKQEAGAIHKLTVVPSNQYVSMLGIEKIGDYFPIAINMDFNSGMPSGEAGFSIYGLTKVQSDYTSNHSLLMPETMADNLMVYVNQKRIELVENDKEPARLNGVDISEFDAADWPKVLVEGRTQLSPIKRIEKLLNVKPGAIRSFSQVSTSSVEGTYREWYDALGFLKDQPMLTYYNDRPVTLDFLLDTDFGKNAMIQHAVNYDTPMGIYALQVLDDYPDVEVVRSGRVIKVDLSGGEATPPTEVNLYFRRLPTPQEVAQIRPYLAAFPDHGLRVFQDCKHLEGDYTLYFGDDFGAKITGFSQLAVGEVYDGPLRFQLKREASGEVTGTTHKPGPKPENAPNTEVFLMIDGVYVNIYSDNPTPYSKLTLDPAPDAVAIGCKINAIERPLMDVWRGKSPWVYTYKAVHAGMVEGFEAMLMERGLGDRPRQFYVNDLEVTREFFTSYQGGKYAYVRIGGWSGRENTPVILEIVD